MKISKVGHTRMAICKSDGMPHIGGVIYDTPENGGQSLRDRVSRAIEKAKRLYKPFNGNAVYGDKSSKDEREAEKQIALAAEEAAGGLLGSSPFKHFDLALLQNSLKTLYNKDGKICNMADFSGGFVREICRKRLKKSLNRVVRVSDGQYDISDRFTYKFKSQVDNTTKPKTAAGKSGKKGVKVTSNGNGNGDREKKLKGNFDYAKSEAYIDSAYRLLNLRL